jgi:hypothetical protein
MKSVSKKIPVVVSNRVSRISVCSRYRRVVRCDFSFGAITHHPFLAFPTRAAKQAGEEKSGQHSQSIEPFRPTRQAVSQSPTRV